MKTAPFKLRSGNRPSIAKLSGISPVKKDRFYNTPKKRSTLDFLGFGKVQNLLDKYGPNINQSVKTDQYKPRFKGDSYKTYKTISSFGKRDRVYSTQSMTDPTKPKKGRHNK